MLGSLAWKVCFYLSCFPMCYACYITRSGLKALQVRGARQCKVGNARNSVVGFTQPPGEKFALQNTYSAWESSGEQIWLEGQRADADDADANERTVD